MRKRSRLQEKMLIGILLMAIVLVAAITTVVAKTYRARMEEYYAAVALDAIEYVSVEVSAEDVTKYYNSLERDDEYDVIHERINNVVKSFGLEDVYIIVPHGDTYTYVFDGVEYTDDDYLEIGTEDVFYGEGQALFENMWNGGPSLVSISDSPEYGYLASVGSAIKDENGTPVAGVCADISMNMVNEQIRNVVIQSMVIALLVIFISMAVYFVFIRKVVITPIDKLAEAANDFPNSMDEEGNLQVTKERYESKDEVGELFASVVDMENSIVTYMKNLRAVTKEKERIGAELNVATQIQANMLPSIFPAFPERSEFDIYATMTPAKEVGGDFYDFFLADENHIAIVIADVSGKGVPAALFMVIAKTLIKNRTLMGGTPAEILEDVNNQLCEGNEAELFVTVWLAIVEISTGKGVASNAGHEYPVLKRKDGDFELIKNRHSPAVATMEGLHFRQVEFELNPGDRLYVYTDGVPEATNAANELYGTDRMVDFLNKNKDATLQDILHGMKDDIDVFVDGAPQFDDVTMLGFDYFGIR